MIQVDSIFHQKFLPKMTVLPLEPAQVQLEAAQVLKAVTHERAGRLDEKLIEICGFQGFFLAMKVRYQKWNQEIQIPKMEESEES